MIILGILSSGCQLLIDNREVGKASVVVVPTTEWDKMRADAKRVAEEKNKPVERPEVIPIEGSEAIKFSNRLDSHLAGCNTMGVIEVIHNGTMEEAIVVLKNEAYRLNSSVLVPVTMEQTGTNEIELADIKVAARMLKCPIKLARGN